jgi:hypothetical protein
LRENPAMFELGLYGEWGVCRVKPNPLSGKALVQGCSSIAFGVDMIKEIESSHRAIGIWTVDFYEDVECEFLKLLQEFAQPRGLQ